jgi:PST family polysaccharide transporter
MSNGVTIDEKFNNSVKWSAITEIIYKLVNPIISMVLARLISPEAFAIVATVTMITSFVDMLTDAGFQKYIIQNDFVDNRDKELKLNVSFWTNFFLSVILFVLIIIFRNRLANLLGNASLGTVISVSSFQIILTSFSSIQTALFKREFMFKSLFKVKISVIFAQLLVTLPLAFLGYSYWAIIIGNLITHIVQASLLMFISTWKPKLKYDFAALKEMFRFSAWSLSESFTVWLTAWIDFFLVSIFFTQYQVGLFKTSTSLVTSLMSIFTLSVIPVLYPTLSRVKHDPNLFKKFFSKTQKLLAFLVLPIGFIVFLKPDIFTTILLGDNWMDASGIIGIWSITNAFKIVYCNLSSEVYRSLGKPKISLYAQLIHLVFLIPIIYISSIYGFETFVMFRSLSRIQFILTHFILLSIFTPIKIKDILMNTMSPIFYSSIAFILGYIIIPDSYGNMIDLILLLLIGIIYLSLVLISRNNRDLFISMFKNKVV